MQSTPFLHESTLLGQLDTLCTPRPRPSCPKTQHIMSYLGILVLVCPFRRKFSFSSIMWSLAGTAIQSVILSGTRHHQSRSNLHMFLLLLFCREEEWTGGMYWVSSRPRDVPETYIKSLASQALALHDVVSLWCGHHCLLQFAASCAGQCVIPHSQKRWCCDCCQILAAVLMAGCGALDMEFPMSFASSSLPHCPRLAAVVGRIASAGCVRLQSISRHCKSRLCSCTACLAFSSQ